MEASEDLHELIQSMSRSEKRYFKLFAQMQGQSDNNYIQLFDAVNKQKEYNEEALKKRFAKNIKQFGSTKFFLYKLILKSLRIFHSEDSTYYVVANQLREADLLIRRNLYKQATKITEKCIETAEKIGAYPLLLTAYQQKQMIVLQMGRTKNYLSELELVCTKGHRILTILQEGLDYAEISAKFNYYTELNTNNGDASLKVLEELMQNPLLLNENRATFFDSQKMFHHIHTLYAYAIKDWRQMYIHTQKRVALYDANPHRIDYDPLSYVAALHNFMIACELEEKYEEELEVLEKMRRVKVKRVDVQAKILLQSLHFELNLHQKRQDKENAQKIAAQLGMELQRIGDKIAYELFLNIHIQLAVFYLMMSDLDKTYEHLEEVLSHPHILKADAVYRHVLILELLYHIAVGNDLLLPTKARSFYRYLQSQTRISDFEKSLIEVSRYKLPNAVDVKAREEVLQSWKEQLVLIFEMEKQQQLVLFEHFDVVKWLEAQV